jgi:hypothetical protein
LIDIQKASFHSLPRECTRYLRGSLDASGLVWPFSRDEPDLGRQVVWISGRIIHGGVTEDLPKGGKIG